MFDTFRLARRQKATPVDHPPIKAWVALSARIASSVRGLVVLVHNDSMAEKLFAVLTNAVHHQTP